MKRILTTLAVCMISFSFAAAQATLPKTQYIQNTSDSENSDDEYEEDEEGDIIFDYGMHLAGDQFIRLSLGISYPLNFPTFSSVLNRDSQLKIGGQASLGYHSFLTSQIALGLEIGFGFNITVGSHSLNTVPLVFLGTYEPTLGRLSFPLSAGIGIAWESYNGKNYFPGLAFKARGGVSYRITENWTAGIDTSYLCLPEFNSLHHSGEKNRFGQFWTVDACARYLF